MIQINEKYQCREGKICYLNYVCIYEFDTEFIYNFNSRRSNTHTGTMLCSLIEIRSIPTMNRLHHGYIILPGEMRNINIFFSKYFNGIKIYDEFHKFSSAHHW